MAAAAAVGAAAVALAVATANLSRFVEANRPRLEAMLQTELGRAVTFGDVGLSVRYGPGVRVRDVAIADDARFGGDVVRADEVVVTVRLLPALLGRFRIREVRLHGPAATVVRDDRGWNLAPERPPERAGTLDPAAPTPPADPPPRGPLILPWPCTVRDGTVRVLDRRVTPVRELVLERVRASVSAAALDRPLEVDVTAAVAEFPDTRLRLAGRLGPVADLAALEHAPLTASLELGAVDGDVLARVATMLDAVPRRRLLAAGPVSFRLRATGPLDALGVVASLDATPAELRWGRYFAKPGELAFEGTLDGSRDGDVLTVRSARLRLGDGELTAAGTIRRGRPWEVDLRVAGGPASVATLARVVPGPVHLDGAGIAEVQATIRGAVARARTPAVEGVLAVRGLRLERAGDPRGVRGLTAERLRLEARLDAGARRPAGGPRRHRRRVAPDGRVRFEVRDGALRGLNLVEQVLAAGTGVPGVATILPQRLRNVRPALFGARDTRFQELSATIRLDGGRARTHDLVFRSDGWGVTGRGSVNRGGELALTATFLADAGLTADVLAAAGPARLLTNRDGMLELPVRITGRLPDVRVQPGRGLLGRVLERALGGRRRDEGRASPRDGGTVVEDALRRFRDLLGR